MRHSNILDFFEPLLDDMTTISSLHREAQVALNNGDLAISKKYERLIQVIHNSIIPASVELGDKTTFAYGGIATILHPKVVIGKNCSIGSNTTIGGGQRPHPDTKSLAPTIGDNVYIATGAKIFGGIKIGSYSIIGANSVITSDVEPFSIMGGLPGKLLKIIDKSNYKKYKSFIGRNINLDDVFMHRE